MTDIYPEDLGPNPPFEVLPGLVVDDKEVVGCCHANLNWRREVRKSQPGLMLPSQLATSETPRLGGCGGCGGMWLNVESVLDGGVNGQEALS